MKKATVGLILISSAFLCEETFAFSSHRMRRARVSAVAGCMTGSTAPGTVCPGGSIFVGLFDGGMYMVTPGGCALEPSGDTYSYPTTDFTPTCSGTDSITKRWNGGGTVYDIPAVENVAASARSSSTHRGNINTAAIVAITNASEGGYHAAARYCDKLSYGGYTDWYLPSKSEMAFLWCRGRTTGNGSYPPEDPGCATYGYGSSSVVPGMASSSYYWTSTEAPSTYADTQGANGNQTATGIKSNSYLIRCARRDPIFIAKEPPGEYAWDFNVANLDVDYLAVPESVSKTLTLKYQGPGPNTSVTLSASSGYTIVYTDCPSASTLSLGSTCQVEIKGQSSGRNQNGLHTGTLTVTGPEGSLLVKLSGTTSNLPDPCLEASPALGTACVNGGYYIGTFDGGKYMVTDGGCGYEPSGSVNTYTSVEFTPSCTGGTDTMTKNWRGTGNNYDIPGVQNVTALATPSSSSFRGDVNTAAIVAITADAEGGYHPAARYCDKLNYGGYTDWYLPSKSEMAFVWCRGRTSGSGSYPHEDPGCINYGYGSTAVVPGLAISGYYWTSTETGSATYATTQGTNGVQTLTGSKSADYLIRCVRRY